MIHAFCTCTYNHRYGIIYWASYFNISVLKEPKPTPNQILVLSAKKPETDRNFWNRTALPATQWSVVSRNWSVKPGFHISQFIGDLLSGIAEGKNDFRNTKDFIHRWPPTERSQGHRRWITIYENQALVYVTYIQ